MPGTVISGETAPRSCPPSVLGGRDPARTVRALSAMALASRGAGRCAKADKEQNSRTVKKDGGTTRQVRFIQGDQSFSIALIGVGSRETLAQHADGSLREF